MTDKYMGLYIELDRLPRYAENVAKSMKFGKTASIAPLVSETIKNLRSIKNIHTKASEHVVGLAKIPQEIEWLLDNWYIAEREGKEAIGILKTADKLRYSGGSYSQPIVWEMCQALCRSGQNEINPQRIEIFLNSFQDELVLTETELCLFVSLLKAALIKALHTACRDIFSDTKNEGLAQFVGNAFTSLRLLSNIDISEITEKVNRTEAALRQDPAGIYSQMDEKTRLSYRHELSRLAKKRGIPEYDAAEEILSLSGASKGKGAHVGYYIFTKPLGDDPRPATGGLYIGVIILASLFVTLLVGFLLDNALISLLLLLPISEVIKNLTDFIVIRTVRPSMIPRLELKNGVPEEGKSICVISALISSGDSAREYAVMLEEYRLANRDSGENLIFGILADLPESKDPFLEHARENLDSAAREIDVLNQKYGGGFVLLYRERSYNERDGLYMGWERKRGALLELARRINGKKSSIICGAGNEAELEELKYIITLDSDTRLNVGAAKELIGAMLHPLNISEVDEKRGIVTEGRGILQPRISVDLRAANRSDFTRIFAGQGGIDPYGSSASDVYQDLFGEGSFAGKGIIDAEAYYKCLDNKFPENTILSHDLLEGSYLRAGYMGDVELTDGYPYKVLSYFERANRWIRGDWQCAPWMFGIVRDAGNKKVKNSLNSVCKWKIFDNLRRSMVPVFTFLALFIGMLISGVDFTWTAAIAILSAASNLLISSAELVFRRDPGTKARYQSTIISGFAGGLIQTIIQLILLPYDAFVCVKGIVTALYRMLVSKRNMLSWVTAAESEKKIGSSIAYYYKKMLPSLILGFLVMIFSPYAAGIAVGLIWALSPVYAKALSREIIEEESVSAEDKSFLLQSAGDIWRYFDEFITPADNYLPPDNWQEQPAAGIAHRTSPTNIGLALLSALAALDLALCTRHKAVGMIENMLATIERMPKWRGHLYNWYDTRTLKSLEPAYVSSVDSGNLAGSLLALREGLLEFGDEETAGLAKRADALLEAMSFKPLYDEKRKFFYIGWDIRENKPTEGWYDLLASEARQTSYIAIARGEVPRKHWRRLGRALVSQDNYSGMASWTGTMFEYLMPNLLMPCYKNSLIYESVKFCVYVQKKRASGVPWGISESAFYSFDPALNYAYKAHGVQRLALKRGLNKEHVVSPYSSFLALPVDTKGAVRNLKKLRRMGMEGRYGFYEAADLTPTRQTGEEFQIVRTYMAHHLGMSLVAIDNTLKGQIMQKRFMRDRCMAAFSELLQEKVPLGEVVLRQPPREIPEKPQRAFSEGWRQRGNAPDILCPRCVTLSNGAYSVLLTETGQSRSVWNGLMLTKFEGKQLGGAPGIIFYLKFGDELFPLTPAPHFGGEIQYSSEFSGGEGKIFAERHGIETCAGARVPAGEMGELRTISIRNTGETLLVGELVCYFEPVLTPEQDYFSHPAFSKLGIETSRLEDSVIMKRRASGKNSAAFMSFVCNEPMSVDTSKEKAIGRGGAYAVAAALERPSQNTLGAVIDPCLLVRVPVNIKPREEKRVRFALAAASREKDAYLAAERILIMPPEKGESRLDGLARLLGMNSTDIDAAMSRLSDLVFLTSSRKARGRYIAEDKDGQRGLWRFGISGDLPVLAAQVSREDCLPRAIKLIHEHSLLVQNGQSYDLALLLPDGGDYRRPIRTKLVEALTKTGRESMLESRGGVHLIDNTQGPESILAAAAVVLDLGEFAESREEPRITSVKSDRAQTTGVEKDLKYYFGEKGEFSFEVQNRLPENAWSNMLSNGRFGYIATDAGTGHMWHLNARENKINNWQNDSLTTDGTEKLFITAGERHYSLFAELDGMKCTVTYGYGFAAWEKEIDDIKVKTTAFVPLDADARVFIIETSGGENSEISYFTELIMGGDRRQTPYVMTGYEDGILWAKNSSNTEFPGESFSLAASAREKGFTCSMESWIAGELDGEAGAGLNPCMGVVYETPQVLVIVTGCGGTGQLKKLCDPAAARQALQDTLNYWQRLTGAVTIKTPDETLNRYLNGWALYQAKACRIYGRSSIYQSGGAYGFRDQLQDVTALIPVSPETAREQILRAAEHQFEEGDVQHWWHPNGVSGSVDKGVRTLCSDDLLWLPYTLCEYVSKTGDGGLCNETAAYLKSEPLAEGEHERYELPQRSELRDTILGHAKKAIDEVLRRGAGVHGLALIGIGDWNDGMNMVGVDGKGESVWLTWFLCHTLERFSELCDKMGEEVLAEIYREESEKYALAANNAWDGEWFLRGYYDDGSTLGSSKDDECQIDSIAQSFGTLTRHGDREKVKTALKSAVERLFDRENKVVRLFAPPFETGAKNPGYIKGYGPGFRENGGQYTHGAIWLAMGCINVGLIEEAYEMLQAILPQNHDLSVYRAEPYVIAADVYYNGQHIGRGGWSWYTGASGWYYRVATECLLGLKLRDGKLFIEPNLPQGWDGYEAVWQAENARYEISVKKTDSKLNITVNGKPYDEKGLPVMNILTII